jgi:hypothetical protein
METNTSQNAKRVPSPSSIGDLPYVYFCSPRQMVFDRAVTTVEIDGWNCSFYNLEIGPFFSSALA